MKGFYTYVHSRLSLVCVFQLESIKNDVTELQKLSTLSGLHKVNAGGHYFIALVEN